MKPVIKFACLANGINLHAWEPEDKSNFFEFLYLEIGVKEEKRSDGFSLKVATPQGLAGLSPGNVIIACRSLVVMSKYEFQELWKWLLKIVSSCGGETWLECVENLGRYFDWEYDNYKSG